MVVLGEDQSFSLTANVLTPGEQSLVLKGYITQRRSDGLYAAPLIPQLFYGVTGAQLGPSWRQNLSTTGEQVILSRQAGYPQVPYEELAWRKVSDQEVSRLEAAPPVGIPWDWVVAGLGFLSLIALAGYVAWTQSLRLT